MFIFIYQNLVAVVVKISKEQTHRHTNKMQKIREHEVLQICFKVITQCRPMCQLTVTAHN